MIPKIIHYCWFGGNPLPKLAIKCIASWKKYLPEYQIIEWNESNFDMEEYVFAKQAFENRKFAFVSDVCRLHALKYYGGIYMDTDVEVLKSLDAFLHHTAFSGFENDDFVPTGIMASEKESIWINEMLSYYHNKPFVKNNGEFEMTSNTAIITSLMQQKGFVMNNKFQEIKNYVAFYPNDYFCPKSYKTGRTELTINSTCIHHFAKSWIAPHRKWRNILKMKVMSILGAESIQKIIDLFKK
jgi:mannosyltransferase OCH1-like enzyme